MRRIYEHDFQKIPPLLDEARRKQAAVVAAATAVAEMAARLDQLPLF
jgi:hypothetical protein